MRIRRFQADTITQALAAVKAALGPEAVILETTEVAGQVVVTAAVDAGDDAPARVVTASDGELTGEVRELLTVVRELVGERWAAGDPAARPEMLLLQRRLLAQGVEGAIAAALVRATAERVLEGVPLGTALAGIFEPAAQPAAPARVRLFVGPPGDGKTTTVVKLAAQARRAGQRVALISTDTYRLGTAAELATYARVLDITVARAADPEELGVALEGLTGSDLVLVDTAGVAPGQATELAELADLTRAAGPEAGRTLVASATTGPWAVRQLWEAFGSLTPDSCVMTKLDLAPGGPLLGRCWRAGVPVTHVTNGRSIPDDLAPATPQRLARCLLAA